MKKKIFSGIAVLAFAAIVGLNVKMNANDNQVSNLALANVEALADGEGGNTRDCPGGSCSYTSSFGSCTACCPQGKSPKCDSWGCSCS